MDLCTSFFKSYHNRPPRSEVPISIGIVIPANIKKFLSYQAYNWEVPIDFPSSFQQNGNLLHVWTPSPARCLA